VKVDQATLFHLLMVYSATPVSLSSRSILLRIPNCSPNAD
jgi:hypothetical protein